MEAAPGFQRRLVWSQPHKTSFIETVLLGLPFPEVFVAAGPVDTSTGVAVELVVDGQQRLTTLLAYFEGDPNLVLPDGVLPYAELPEEDKIRFLEYEVVVRDLGAIPLAETKQIFERINSTSYALNAMEVNSGRFDGHLKRVAEDLAACDFFASHRTFSPTDVRRMDDTKFVLTIIITMLAGYFNRDDDHAEFLERFNELFPYESEIVARFEFAFNWIGQCDFDSSSRVWKKTDLFTLIVEIDRMACANKYVDPAEAAARLASFYMDVRAGSVSVDALDYYKRISSGVNDRRSREVRGEAIRKVLNY